MSIVLRIRVQALVDWCGETGALLKRRISVSPCCHALLNKYKNDTNDIT